MSFLARRELLAQVASRYRQATRTQRRTMLDEFVASTGYARKYAIRLLTQPPPPTPTRRSYARTPQFGPAVQAALIQVWSAANGICAKRLVPFLPELVESLERHGHLALTAEVREQLLTLSAATADRLLRSVRQQLQPRGSVPPSPVLC